MGYSKRQICTQAFTEIAISGDEFDLDPSQLQTALARLDGMIAAWEGQGLRTGYALPDPLLGSELDDDSGVPDTLYETLYTNLAIRLSVIFGKQLSQDTRNNAKQGYDALATKAVMPRPMQLPATMPRGAGNRPWRTGREFHVAPNLGPLHTSPGGDLDLDTD